MVISVVDLKKRDQRVAFVVAHQIARYRAGGDVEIRQIPEEDDRVTPAVELVTEDDVGLLVLEHTRIEPFTGQIREDHRIKPYADAIPPLVAAQLPAGSRFELIVRVGEVDGVAPKQAVLQAIADWTIRTAPSLVDGRPGGGGTHVARSEPPDTPVAVSLVRWPHETDGPIPALTIGRCAPPDLEQRREDRLVEALQAKLPKLTMAASGAAERVLIVESNDLSLSSAVDIRSAIRRAAEKYVDDLPEWTVLWEQILSDPHAALWLLRISGAWDDAPQPIAVAGVPTDR